MKKLFNLLEGLRIDRAISFVWQAAARWTVASIVLLFFQAIVPIATLYIFKLIVDYLTQPEGLSSLGISFEHLVGLLLVALGLGLLSNFSDALLTHINAIQNTLVSDFMQRLVQAKSIELDLAYYENSQFYDKLHRAQLEAPNRPLLIIESLTEFGRYGLTLLGAVIVLLMFHWSAIVIIFIASLPVLIYRLKYADALYQLQQETTQTQRITNYLNKVLTTVDHAKEVRAFGFGPFMAERFSQLRLSIREKLRHVSAQGAKRQFFTESTATIAGYGALAFIVYAAVNKSISLGEMVMYIGAFQVAVGSLRPTLSAMAELYENNLFLSTLYEFLDLPKKVLEPCKAMKMAHPWRSGLKVENLSFHYPDTERSILSDINLAIQPGEIIALVGRNGSGKTTLTKLLSRLYDPDKGFIRIDGVDIREFSTEDLRKEISVIYQDFGRYHLTARENIMLGFSSIDANNPAIAEAAQWAGIHGNLMQLPNGYETVMGRTFEDGAELSIGQWQKLALARAFVRNAQLILLDEPTSSLDAASEFEFFEKFRDMIRSRSALIISHRFSTVRLADRIYVLDGGRLIEQGNHEELLAYGGLYADLYSQQAFYYQSNSFAERDMPPPLTINLSK